MSVDELRQAAEQTKAAGGRPIDCKELMASMQGYAYDAYGAMIIIAAVWKIKTDKYKKE